MFGSEGGMGFGMGTGMWIFWILLIVIIIAVIKVFAGGSSGSTTSSHESPLEILRVRYARGEIDEEEFERRRKELEK